jgi:hypothetical protein
MQKTKKATNKLIIQLTVDIIECNVGFQLCDVTTTGETFPTTKHSGSLKQTSTFHRVRWLTQLRNFNPKHFNTAIFIQIAIAVN